MTASGNYSSDGLSMLKCPKLSIKSAEMPKIVNQIKLSLNSNCKINFSIHLSNNCCSGHQIQLWEISWTNVAQNQHFGNHIWIKTMGNKFERGKKSLNPTQSYGGWDQLKAEFETISYHDYWHIHIPYPSSFSLNYFKGQNKHPQLIPGQTGYCRKASNYSCTTTSHSLNCCSFQSTVVQNYYRSWIHLHEFPSWKLL